MYHEDNFANVPEITIVWPVPPQYQKDAYALDFLAKILPTGKKHLFIRYLLKRRSLLREQPLTITPKKLAGEFTITIRANEGKTLKEIEDAVNEAFARFEKEGITEKDVERVKASSEKNFYSQIESVFGKSLQLAFYNTYPTIPDLL